MFIKPFEQIGKEDVMHAGGKGASLGEMIKAGIPVPPGYVILSETFDRFLEHNNLLSDIDAILHTVDHEVTHTVDDASAKIRAIIEGAEIPQEMIDEIQSAFVELGAEFVAVRSSATSEDSADAAWAGQLETYLNTTDSTLIEHVKKCWSSLFTPRAIFYRFEKALHRKPISVAVVVQKMIASEKSGIAFSVHPVTEDYNQLIIEAGFGLGEAIVSGSITPDSYVVKKDNNEIFEKMINEQMRSLVRGANGGTEWKDLGAEGSESVLSDEQVLELGDIIKNIEIHYGFPVDVEWAFESETFYITQSRPITTLSAKAEITTSNEPSNSLEDRFLTEISRFDWKKDWEARFSVLICDMTVPPYFYSFMQEFGENIPHVLVTSRDGVASCFISKVDTERFSNSLLKLVEEDSSCLSRWAKSACQEYDKASAIISLDTKDVLKRDVLIKLSDHMHRFTAFLGAMKYVAMVLTAEQVETIGQPIVDARKYSESIYFDLEAAIQNWAEYIADKESVEETYLGGMFTEELMGYVTTRELPELDVLKARFEKSAILYGDKRVLLLGNDVDTVEQIVYGEGERLQGQGCFPGKVKGTVKIIIDFTTERDKFEPGDILVTGMTDPNYVPLMKKASAIVTDGGGLLSHAAIVSRELKVPCVIGTERATRVLKDGDQVEVDADNGIVKKL